MHQITHPSFIRKQRSFFVAGRSYQEFSGYSTVEDYFKKAFDPKADEADIVFISTHLNLNDAQTMITQGRRRFYNVCGLFFDNSVQKSRSKNAKIAELAWDELWYADNQPTSASKKQQDQLWQIAEAVLQMLIARQRAS